MKRFLFIAISALFISAVFAFPASASITDGAIDSTYKYAWGENIGWLNFGTSDGNVHITDSALTGYAWSENYGWINLNPATSGIKNDGAGVLSGYGWSENLGWINFSGVTINTSGDFLGYAVVSNDSGRISFNCINANSCGLSDFKVKTDWRPRSARPACNNATDDDGDGKIDYPSDPGCSSLEDTDEIDPGGGMPSAWYNPPAEPTQGFAVSINNNAEYTNNLTVTLNLRGGSNTERMAVSNFADFRDTGQETFAQTKTWNLCAGQENICEKLRVGELTSYEFYVYAKFYAPWGTVSDTVSDKIAYQPSFAKATEGEEEKPITEKIPEAIAKISEKIKEFFKPKRPEEKPKLPPIEEVVLKEAPLSFSGKWKLISYTEKNFPLEKFVLAPLPKEFRKLAEKFPTLEKTFEEVGISKITDVIRLKAIQLALPGLTERVGLPTAKVEPGKFALPAGIPVAELSPQIKERIPSEIVFAKTGGELIDFNIALSIDEKGEPQQKISTISGKPLQLVVKPDKPVKSVKGYVVFKSKKVSLLDISAVNELVSLRVNGQSANLSTSNKIIEEFSLKDLAASLFFSNPVFTKLQEKPVRIEEKLVLLEFEYTDPDGDGIYTAEIQVPVVAGEYEIITVMDYEDIALGSKEIRLITVVDPEGYVWIQMAGGIKGRIPGAVVSLYWLNPQNKQYELWPAKEYQQENPQVTDDTGKYSFLVPPGMYYLKVETPKYPAYQSDTFSVKEGSGIHMNIELKTKYWWLKTVDWRTFLLIGVVLLLLYNFHRDRIREKLLRK